MLNFFLVASCLVVSILGQSETSEGEFVIAGSNFFQYTFNSLLYIPYAADQCSATDLAGTVYIMPTCIDDTTIEVSMYSDSTCDTLTSQDTYNSTSSQIFVCGGSSSYIGISLGISECSVVFYSGFRSCIQHSTASTDLYSSIDCTSTLATMSIYETSTCSSDVYTEYYFNSTCSHSFDFSSVEIYGQVVSCSVETPVTTTSGESESEEETTETETETTESDGETETLFTTTASTGSGGGSGGDSDAANRISFNNLVGIFVMIGSIIIAKL
jgi:hypothetical protein